MDLEDYYQQRVLQIAAIAKEIEENWAKENPDDRQKMIEQKPSFEIHGGGYRAMGWKTNHPDYSWDVCGRCSGTSMKFNQVAAGCRHNGDAYGSYVNYCGTCGFLCWISYDEA
jgi:hypothetical protein